MSARSTTRHLSEREPPDKTRTLSHQTRALSDQTRALSNPPGALSVSAGFVAAVCERCLAEGSADWLNLLRPLMEAGALIGAQEPRLLAALCSFRQVPRAMLS